MLLFFLQFISTLYRITIRFLYYDLEHPVNSCLLFLKITSTGSKLQRLQIGEPTFAYFSCIRSSKAYFRETISKGKINREIVLPSWNRSHKIRWTSQRKIREIDATQRVKHVERRWYTRLLALCPAVIFVRQIWMIQRSKSGFRARQSGLARGKYTKIPRGNDIWRKYSTRDAKYLYIYIHKGYPREKHRRQNSQYNKQKSTRDTKHIVKNDTVRRSSFSTNIIVNRALLEYKLLFSFVRFHKKKK